MKTIRQTLIAPVENKLSRQIRRAARFSPGRSIKIRFGGRMMLLVWRTRARVAQLLGCLLKRSLRQSAAGAIAIGLGVSAAPSYAAVFNGDLLRLPLIPNTVPVIPQVNIPSPLPSGGITVFGQATVSTAANLMTVNQATPQAIVNWTSFNIDPGYKVKFVQPGVGSSILNRVNSGSMSSIQGQLEANGKVWLINPAGIMIGPGATIDVAGFVASTLKVSDSDFLANSGRINFNGDAGAGAVSNSGLIKISNSGSVYLVGSSVTNNGLITAASGEVLLAAGHSVQFVDAGLPGVKVEVTNFDGGVTNFGQIVSESGRIGLAGVFARSSGSLNANSVTSTGGRIFLQANKDATLANGSITTASGSSGGHISFSADGMINSYGSVAATGNSGPGGTVEFNGKNGINASYFPVTGTGGNFKLKTNNVSVGYSYSETGTSINANALSELLNVGTNVTIEADAGNIPGLGNVIVNSPILKSRGADATFTLLASNTISLSSSITSTVGKLGVVLSVPDSDSMHGSVQLNNAVMHLNGGTLRVNGPLTLNGNNSVSAMTLLANSLTLNSGSTDMHADFSNTGNVHIQNGTLRFSGATGVNNLGKIQIDAGATLAADLDLTNAKGATISGTGTIALNEHSLINNGTVAPGTSTNIGTLTINGNYTQGKTGELIAKINRIDGIANDQLLVTGATKLDGALTISSLNGYAPAVGDAFTVISGGFDKKALGAFTSVSAPDYLNVGYGLFENTPVRVNYVSSGTNFFNNAGGDLNWANASNWSGGHAPAVFNDVLIDTGFTVQHTSGNDKIRSLIINANNGLNISGGSIAVSNTSVVDGTLTVGAGATALLKGGLTGTGTLSIAGGNVNLGSTSTIANLSMSDGVLSSAANFTVTNSLQQIGGAMQFEGAKVDLYQSTGDLLINNLTANTANLAATNGAITQTGGALTLGALTTQSKAGTRLDGAANLITNLSAINTGTGDIAVTSLGALALTSVSNTGGAVFLSAGGAITQTGVISGKALTTSSIGGTTLNGANRVSSFSALNKGGGDISLFNTTRPDALTLLSVKNTAGSIAIDNTGAIITSGALDAAGGTLTLTAHSPITVNSGLTARDGITLTALPSSLGIDTVAINGTLASTTGNILVTSGTNTTVGSNATLQVTPGSVIALTALKGEVGVLKGATFVGAQPTISQSVVAPVAPAPLLPVEQPPVPVAPIAVAPIAVAPPAVVPQPPPSVQQSPVPVAPVAVVPQSPLAAQTPVPVDPPVALPQPLPVEPAVAPRLPQSLALNTIDNLQKTAEPFGKSLSAPNLLASRAASIDTDSSDSNSGSGSKKADDAESSGSGAKSNSDKSAKSLPVCN